MINLTGININDNEFIALKSVLFRTQTQIKASGNHHLWSIVNKYDIEMDNCYVASSPVHNLGVFSNRNMIQGDIITIYPADVAIQTTDSSGNYNLLISKELYNLKFNDIEFTDKSVKELCSNFFHNYLINLTENIQISATPELHSNPTYIGHMINDGTTVLPTNLNMEHEYYNSSQTNANCCYKCYNNVLFVIATKNISKDEEIFGTYGSKYWLSDRNKPME